MTKPRSKAVNRMHDDAQMLRCGRAEMLRAGRRSLGAANGGLSHRDPRSLSVHPCSNVHRCQLLEEQFRRIRNVHLRDPRLVLARPALERVPLEVPGRNRQRILLPLIRLGQQADLRDGAHQPADITNVHSEGVRHFE